MTIAVGDKLPDASFTSMTAEGPTKLSTAEVFGGRKVVLFAVPGAFTPTCHMTHLPGFVANADAIRQKGADAIACVSVNDVFVMDAWAKQVGADDKMMFLADGNGDFTSAVGMAVDSSAFGMGQRSRRYSMIVEDRTVTALNIEPAAKQAIESGAEKILEQL